MCYTPPVEIVYESKIDSESTFEANFEASIVEKLSALHTGMKRKKLTKLVHFVEALRQSGRHSLAYLRKEDTKMPRTIELDALNDRIFIHLKTHNVSKVGKGAHKRVTYSILYDPIHPQLIASAIAEDDETTRAEVELLEKFRGLECIIEPLYIGLHTKKSGKLLYEIITPLYNKGSLRTFITKNPKSIPLNVKLKIAKDILTGSSALNSMGYVSRDTNRGNFFIHEAHGDYKAVLGDLGGYTEEVGVALHRKPFGPSARAAPPDLQRAYYEKRLTEQDLFSNHVYALGRVFYFLHFEKELPWLDRFKEKYPLLSKLYKDPLNPALEVELDTLTQEINSHTKARFQELGDLGLEQPLTGEERFEQIILSMLSLDPECRKTNAYWHARLEHDLEHELSLSLSIEE